MDDMSLFGHCVLPLRNGPAVRAEGNLFEAISVRLKRRFAQRLPDRLLGTGVDNSEYRFYGHGYLVTSSEHHSVGHI